MSKFSFLLYITLNSSPPGVGGVWRSREVVRKEKPGEGINPNFATACFGYWCLLEMR